MQQDILGQSDQNTNAEKIEDNTQKTTTAETFLTFYIDNHLFAIPSKQIVEIITIQEITYIPNLPDFVKGVTNIRGKIVPLIDLRIKFHMESSPYDQQTCIIITETETHSVGYIVDKVSDVTNIAADQISDPPKATDSFAGYITGITKINQKITYILDVEEIILDDFIENENLL
jgi:purine-binding chemotaxis protein CheW